MSIDQRLRFDGSERPALTDLRRQPPADGLSGLRRKLMRADAEVDSRQSAARAFATRPSRAVLATASAIAVVGLSIGVIHQYRSEQTSERAAVARALNYQLRLAEQPLPSGVVAGDPSADDAFEVDTGNPEIRFYWVLKQERPDGD